MKRPKIGDERYLLETMETAAVEAMARNQGWPGRARSRRRLAGWVCFANTLRIVKI